MAKTKISEFSATPGNNTDIDGINIAEGCAPSGINDAIRELMAQLKDFQAGTAGDSFNGPVGTTTAAAGAFTTLTTSGAVTHNGGTANGVAYLNGSKVLTTGSALTFDGTNLTVPAEVYRNSDSSYLRLAGGNPAATGATVLMFGSTHATNPNRLSLTAPGATATSYIDFNAAGAEGMRLTSTGLGIGTSSPATKLQVTGGSIHVDRSVGGGASQLLMTLGASSGGNFGQISNTGTYWALGYGSSQSTVGTQSVIWDTSGNLGLGVTPSAWYVYKAMQVGQSGAVWSNPAANELYLSSNYYYSSAGDKYIANGYASFYRQLNGAHTWATAPSGTAGNAISFTQAATLTAAGDFLVGTTSTTNNSRFACNNTAGTRKWGFGTQGSNTPFYVVDDTTGSGVQLTAGATAWSSFSDERNKTQLKPFENAIEKVCTLRSGTGRYLTDNESVSRSFLIAQDVQKVLPEAVSVSEDEQGTLTLRYTDLIPLLAAAIKELKAEFDAYKAAHP